MTARAWDSAALTCIVGVPVVVEVLAFEPSGEIVGERVDRPRAACVAIPHPRHAARGCPATRPKGCLPPQTNCAARPSASDVEMRLHRTQCKSTRHVERRPVGAECQSRQGTVYRGSRRRALTFDLASQEGAPISGIAGARGRRRLPAPAQDHTGGGDACAPTLRDHREGDVPPPIGIRPPRHRFRRVDVTERSREQVEMRQGPRPGIHDNPAPDRLHLHVRLPDILPSARCGGPA